MSADEWRPDALRCTRHIRTVDEHGGTGEVHVSRCQIKLAPGRTEHGGHCIPEDWHIKAMKTYGRQK